MKKKLKYNDEIKDAKNMAIIILNVFIPSND